MVRLATSGCMGELTRTEWQLASEIEANVRRAGAMLFLWPNDTGWRMMCFNSRKLSAQLRDDIKQNQEGLAAILAARGKSR